MRMLVLGARGTVGRVVVDHLRALGHDVTPAGRSVGTDGARVDLSDPPGHRALHELARFHDAVVNASGIEDPKLATVASAALFVDISATAAYLGALSAAAPSGARILAGAGLVPGLSTVLLNALDARSKDDLDLAVVLGGGEAHGSAAVAWTAALAGQPVYAPPEGHVVVNFEESRRLPGAFGVRRHLRADFPDHILVGAPRQVSVRTYLAVDSRLSTAALGLVGRFPELRGLVSRAPHLGGDGWSLTALNRRTGETITASGRGQSATTGALTARLTDQAVRGAVTGVVTAAHVLGLDDVRCIPGIRVG